MRILQVLPSLQLQRRTLRGFPSSESMESSSPPVLFAHLAMSRSLFSTAFCTCNPNQVRARHSSFFILSDKKISLKTSKM